MPGRKSYLKFWSPADSRGRWPNEGHTAIQRLPTNPNLCMQLDFFLYFQRSLVNGQHTFWYLLKNFLHTFRILYIFKDVLSRGSIHFDVYSENFYINQIFIVSKDVFSRASMQFYFYSKNLCITLILNILKDVSSAPSIHFDIYQKIFASRKLFQPHVKLFSRRL